MKKILILVLFFYFLALFQASFLVHFKIWGMAPNLILILVIFINLFERPKNITGISSAVIGGFFLDIFSSKPIGFEVLILLGLAVFIKIILKRYVQIPDIKPR